MYDVAVHMLAQQLLEHIRTHNILKAGDRVGVAVSGGVDSVALLRLLLELRRELGIVLSVVHFNHKLRGAESDADQEFVASLARQFDLEFYADSDDVAQHAAEEHVSVETAARELRYGFFRSLFDSDLQGLKPEALGTIDGRAPSKLNKIATGHTLDDQAETVLMRLIRGSGLRGLGGIHPRLAVEDDAGELCGEIIRPLLATRRCELETYLHEIGQPWREDSSNANYAFTRNRIRKLLVPLLEKEFNPAIAETLSELAEIARGEEDYWENEAAGWMGTAVHWSEPDWARVTEAPFVQISISRAVRASSLDSDLQSRIDDAPWLVANATVSRMWFLGEPIAVQRRVVKAIGERAGIPLEFKHVEEVLQFAADEEKFGKELSLPLGWKLTWHEDEILFLTPVLRQTLEPSDYEYSLSVPGRVAIPEAGLNLQARDVPAEAVAGYNPDELLDADSLTGPFKVRNWRAGDRFWPAHIKSPKKIKEILQERHVPQPERALWPVVMSGNEIVWVRGFPASAKHRPRPGLPAILISEEPFWDDKST